MDELLGLLVVAALAMPVLLVIFMVWTVQLSRRVRQMEATVARLAPHAASVPADEAATTEEPEDAAVVPEAVAPTPKKPETTTRERPDIAAEAVAGPWAGATTAEPPTKRRDPPRPPKAVVFRADRARALADWLRANWIYAVSAVSLAFAGLFLVQYGIEAGYLTPSARVFAALAFGAALVIGGEYIRRRWGGRAEVATAFLPSLFAGAGIVTLFGAVLAALHLYGLIGPGVGFAGLVAVAGLAIGLGWYSGPLLAALGLVGAFGAPFLVGGESDMPELFYGYFGLVALVGLVTDAGKRWAWVSVLALGLAYPAITMLYLGAGWPEFYSATLVVLVLASMAVPTLTLSPAHDGAALIESFAKTRKRGWPEFPTRLVAGSMIASVAGLVLAGLDGAGGFWIALVGLAALFFAVAVWADRAEALEDLAALPALALVGLPVAVAWLRQDPFSAFQAVRYAEEGTPVPNDPYLLVALGVAVSLMAAWRSHRGARWPVAWGAGAALVAPAMVAGLEFSWAPGDLLGAYPWALATIAVAALMVALALGFVRSDGESRPRVAGFALGAVAMISLALALIFTDTALTLAFAATLAAAAALDRRFNLRALSVAVQVGAVALAWRLIVDPGVDWALDAPYWELVLGYGGAIAALFSALWLLRPLGRTAAVTLAESAGWTLSAIFASILIFRLLDDLLPGAQTESHWFVGLLAVVWLAASANQLWRLQLGGKLAILRWVLAGLYAVIGFFVLGIGLTFLNPALNYDGNNAVYGWPVLNTLALGYLLPALLLGAVGWRFGFLPLWLRRALQGFAVALGVLWIVLAIRHFWRGAGMDNPGFTEPELYSYTMAMLIAGAGLLYQAIARRSAGLRKAAMVVIGLTVAKVFLVDISGLVGLLRVFSFLALGLALAGLAFLNRWAAGQIAEGEEEADG